MLTMHAYGRWWPALIGLLLCGLPALAGAEDAHRSAQQVAESRVQPPGHQPVGAPQVLEIPPVQETTPVPTEPSSGTVAAPPRETPPELYDYSGATETDQTEMTRRRTYFGVLYATAEEEAVGVKVLDVIPGSPAARAGFEGANKPPSTRQQLTKVAIVGAAPFAGPFAPLIILTYAMLTSGQSPGDLIVAVGDQQVHDAVEFSQEMRRYQPGDTVTFSVLRSGKSLQIPVQLEEEPS